MSDQTKRKIFFNYRRADNPDFVERIRDWFAWKYGRDSVFMDFDTIPPFTAFADFIREKVRECDLLVAIIGPEWSKLLSERMAMTDEEDYVQTEIRLALEEGKPIAPICIKKAIVPRVRDLPPQLRPMMDYHVAHLDAGKHFLDNIERILDGVEQQLTKLDALKVIAQVQQVEFDVFAAIQSYQDAADKEEWKKALDWIEKIRHSGFVPSFYPLEDYEQQARDALKMQQTEREYNIIRTMAQRATQKEARERVWAALETFWQTHPAYDPDNLTTQFRPKSIGIQLNDFGTARDSISVVKEFPELEQVLTGLDKIQPEIADAVFNFDTLEQIVEKLPRGDQSITIEEAQDMGIDFNLEA